MFPPLSGGAAMQAFYLVHALGDRRGVRVHVIAPGPELPDGDNHWLPSWRTRVHRVPFAFHGGKVPLADAIAKGIDVLRELQARSGQAYERIVLSAQHFGGVFVGIHLKLIFGHPLIATVHKTPIGASLDATVVEREPAYAHMKWLARQAIDGYVAGSKVFRNELRRVGIQQKKISLIYHGVPARWLRDRADGISRERVMQFLGFDANQRYVICPTRADHRKSLRDFFAAAAQVITEAGSSQVKFLVTGEPEDAKEREAVLALADSTRLRAEALLLRRIPLEWMPAVMRNAELCVLPSKREGLGMALLEAMALQKPVIGSDVPGVDEIIENNVNGFLYPEGNTDVLTYKMSTLLNDRNVVERLVRTASERLKNDFTADNMMTQHEKLYRSLV